MKIQIPTTVQKTLRWSFIATTLLAAITMVISFVICFRSDSHYFTKDQVLPTIAIAFACIAALVGTADALLATDISLENRAAWKPAPLFAGIGFLLYGIYQMITAATNLSMVCAILLIVASAHFVFSFFAKAEYKLLTFYLGIAAVLGCALLTICFYFDMTLEMNAPIKVLPQIALLCAMIYFTSELRCYIDRHAPRAYRVLCAWTIVFGACSSLPMLIAYLIGSIRRTDLLFVSILLLGITAMAILRWVSVSLIKTNGDTDQHTN